MILQITQKLSKPIKTLRNYRFSEKATVSWVPSYIAAAGEYRHKQNVEILPGYLHCATCVVVPYYRTVRNITENFLYRSTNHQLLQDLKIDDRFGSMKQIRDGQNRKFEA